MRRPGAARIIVPAVQMTALLDEITGLIDEPMPGDRQPHLERVERLLTDGYAQALALEAERWRLERRIAQVAAELGRKSQDDEHSELTQLGQRLSLADGDLSNLRGLLSSLRSRADEVRATV
jgi:ABC-type phosphate transport system auxiliary subunit